MLELTRQEEELFELLLGVVVESGCGSTLRVAGGWVRDKVRRRRRRRRRRSNFAAGGGQHHTAAAVGDGRQGWESWRCGSRGGQYVSRGLCRVACTMPPVWFDSSLPLCSLVKRHLSHAVGWMAQTRKEARSSQAGQTYTSMLRWSRSSCSEDHPSNSPPTIRPVLQMRRTDATSPSTAFSTTSILAWWRISPRW